MLWSCAGERFAGFPARMGFVFTNHVACMPWSARSWTAPKESAFPSCHSIETIVGETARAGADVTQMPPVATSIEQAAIRIVLRGMERAVDLIAPSCLRGSSYSTAASAVKPERDEWRDPLTERSELHAYARLVGDVDELLCQAALLRLTPLLTAAERQDRLALHRLEQRRERRVDREGAERDAHPPGDLPPRGRGGEVVD